jgi:hypothetical protein
MLRLVVLCALDDQHPDLAWSLLLNLTATKSIENKKKLLNLSIPLARLVSERGIPVLRNLCAGGPEHAVLIEPLIVPTIALIASGLDPSATLEAPMEFLANIAATGEMNKSAICNDTRILGLIVRALESSTTSIRLSAARCVMNLVWCGDADDRQQASPRSPMFRLVHARVMAAASRSPLRLTGLHSSSGASSSRQTKLVNFGILERLQRMSEDDEDDLVKDTAHEAMQLLSS